MTPNPPELVWTAEITIQVGSPMPIPGGPVGTRIIAEILEISVVGDRLNASMAGRTGADWLTVGPDGTYGTLDVRLTLKTDDDVLVYCEYGGRIDFAAGTVVTAPLFQCGDDRYEWLNRAQFLCDGSIDAATNTLTYQLYEVRLR